MKKAFKLLTLLASIGMLASCGGTTSSEVSSTEEVSSVAESSVEASSSIDDADDNSYYSAKYFEDELGIFFNGLLDYNFTVTFDGVKEITVYGDNAIYTKYLGENAALYTNYGIVDSKTYGYWEFTLDENDNFQLGSMIYPGNPKTKHIYSYDSVYAGVRAFINSYETWEGHTENAYYTLNDTTFNSIINMLGMDTDTYSGRSATLYFVTENTIRVEYSLYEVDKYGDSSDYGEGSFYVAKKSAQKINGLDAYLADPQSYVKTPTEFTADDKTLMKKYLNNEIPFINGISSAYSVYENESYGYVIMDDYMSGDITENAIAALEADGWTLDTDNSGDSGYGYYIYSYYKGAYQIQFAYIPSTALADDKTTQYLYPYGLFELLGNYSGTLRTMEEINAGLPSVAQTSDNKQAVPTFDFGTYTITNPKWEDETSTYAAYGYTFVYAFSGSFSNSTDAIAALNGYADTLIANGYENALDEDYGYTDPKLSETCTGIIYTLEDAKWTLLGIEIDLGEAYDTDGNTYLDGSFTMMIYSY